MLNNKYMSKPLEVESQKTPRVLKLWRIACYVLKFNEILTILRRQPLCVHNSPNLTPFHS